MSDHPRYTNSPENLQTMKTQRGPKNVNIRKSITVNKPKPSLTQRSMRREQPEMIIRKNILSPSMKKSLTNKTTHSEVKTMKKEYSKESM